MHTVNQQQLPKRQLKTRKKNTRDKLEYKITKGKNNQARQYCVQFLVIVFLTIINSLTLSPQSFTSHQLVLL